MNEKKAIYVAPNVELLVFQPSNLLKSLSVFIEFEDIDLEESSFEDIDFDMPA